MEQKLKARLRRLYQCFSDEALNADLPKLGGIETLVDIITRESEEGLVAAAQYTLGIAASNNPSVQMAALAYGSLMTNLLEVRPELSPRV